MEILHLKELGDTESVSRLPMYTYIFKAIGQFAMDILHLKDLGDIESVVTNAVVRVLGEIQISIATYLRGYLPSYKIVLHCIGN